MAINYNDSRFTNIKNQEKTAMNEVNTMYNNMINSTDKLYQDQINAAEDYAKTQSNLQQQQTDLAIEQINQNKEYQKQDYTKEQKASYVDYQKQSNSYGANAESMAARGLTGTGYAESSQVSMYNQYQNRYATARETYTRAITEYDNQIKDAQLQNSSALAEIAYNALQKKLELSLQGFQYKNTLLQQQLEAKNNVSDRYYNRYQDVVNQINTENALAEQQRQFNANLALQKEQFAWQKSQAAKSSSSSSGSSSKSSKSSGSSSINKSNSSSSSNSISKDKTSTYAKNYATALSKQAPKGTLTGASKIWKSFATAQIQKDYDSGKLTESDVKYVVNKLGL